MTRIQIEDFISSRHVEQIDTVLLMDGLDAAFVGVDLSDPPRAVYSKQRILAALAEDMSYQDAVEYFEFNIECAHVGDQTPLIIDTP